MALIKINEKLVKCKDVILKIIKFIQTWTTQDIQNIQSSVITKHDFEDGQGEVPAIPYDDMEAKTKLKNMIVSTSPNDKLKANTQLDNVIVSKTPNDYIMPTTEIHSMIVSTTPNDKIYHNTEIHNFIISKSPNDYVYPITEIHSLIVSKSPNDKLNASLSLIEFNIE